MDMADIFDITSSKKARSSYEDSGGNYKSDWDLKLRRDPRLKSPSHDKDETSNRSQSLRDPRQSKQDDSNIQQTQQTQDNWMPNQIDYRQVQTQYSIVRDSNVPIMSSMYNEQRQQQQQQQQYNTAYPTPISQTQSSQYPYHTGDVSHEQRMQLSSSGIQQEYSQNQYQMPSAYYPNMNTNDGNYLQAPPPPAWQSQGQTSSEFRDVPRPPPPPRMSSQQPQQQATSREPTQQRNQSDQPNNDDLKKEAAIAQEVKHQRATLCKQRGEYFQKASLLKRELDVLQTQKEELLLEVGSGSIPRETQRILKENHKLQVEIQTKLKAINNVIEMLSGIIGEDDDKGFKQQSTTSERSNSPAENMSSITQTLDSSRAIYNFVHYDPELHWCRVCDVFPNSAKDFLMHLQSEQHFKTTKQHQLVDMPWHNAPPEPELPSNPEGPVKRTPIKGIQFFIPAQAWYCKLCDKWIGDLHCASAHLKSKLHIQNFTNFVEQNPHWETDWISDRQKAFSRVPNSKKSQESSEVSGLPDHSLNAFGISSDTTKSKKRKKHGKDKRDSRSSSRDKKKKKKSKKRRKHSSDSSSSSSSSTDTSSDEELESDKSRSIRVAMRNKMKMQAQMILSEELGEKLDVLTKLVEDGTQRQQNQQKQVESTEHSTENKNNEKVEKNSILPKDKDILTFHTFRNKLKQSQNFKQSHSVSLSLLGNRKEEDDDKKSTIKEKSIDDNSKRSTDDSSRRSRERDNREKDRDRSSRYSDDRRDRDRSSRYSDDRRDRDRDRRSSPSRKKYDRYSPDRKYKKSSPPFRKYGSPDRKKYGRDDRYHDDKYTKKSDSEKFSKGKDGKRDEDAKSEKNESGEKIKFPVTAQQKKLPLIGRMPLFKKKQDSDDKKSNEIDKSRSKFSTDYNNTINLPAPGIVHVTKLSVNEYKFTPDNPPPPPQIIPDPPMIIPEPPQISAYMCAPPPPILSQHMMEPPEDQIPMMMLPQEQPTQKGALPPDLQDALNIIFPGDMPKDAEGNASQEAMMMAQYQMMENYPYTGYDGYNVEHQPIMPPLPPNVSESNARIDHGNPSDKNHMEIDDLAMLGIDAEDLAAQNL